MPNVSIEAETETCPCLREGKKKKSAAEPNIVVGGGDGGRREKNDFQVVFVVL